MKAITIWNRGEETWLEDDTHCPYCGISPTYVEPGDGDYYVGAKYICLCGSTFTMQGGAVDENRAALIRAVVEAS